MSAFEVEELVIPTTVDSSDAADFVTSADIRGDIERESYGTDDLRLSAEELLPWFRDPKSPRRLFGVRVDGRLVARAMYDHLVDEPTTGWAHVGVLPPFRRRGIGQALAEAVEGIAREAGRSKLVAYAPSPDAPGPRIASPTGFGSVPAENPEVHFLVGRGYRLEQVERFSRLPLPFTGAVPTPPDGYRLQHWAGFTPDEWLEDMAHLYTRMSIDAPSAGLDEPEDVYTVDRVRVLEEEQAKSPLLPVTVAVEHVASGRLAGFSTLLVPREPSRAVQQDDTLVLSEHRGHRLGMLLKLANLRHLELVHEGHPSVTTFNAEENRFMLDINEAVGFVPLGHEGAWRLDLR